MVRVRFAPSPTGYLHLGNVRTALFNYLFAKKHGGKFILRIEDTDALRSKDEYRKALIDDLKWLGLEWDEGPGAGGDSGPYLQSERLGLYKQYVQKLVDEGKAYYCYVTEEETGEAKRLAKQENRPLRFDNRGRFFSSQEIEARKAGGIQPTVRFKIDDPCLEMDDLVRGKVRFNLDDMVGDFVILRADGMPTFHLAVCVDDALMGITHVIRGEDHLSNTPKHILLLRAMGFEPPQYGHLSLVLGPGGEPLSKRIESISVREFRRRGYLPEGLANYIALLGWSPGDDREILAWEELKKLFDLDRVSKSPSCYDPGKLDWVNGQHLRLLDDASFTRQALDYLKARGKLNYDEALTARLLPVLKDHIERFEQLEGQLGVLSDDFDYENPVWVRSPEAKEIFRSALDVLGQVKGKDEELYDLFVNQLKTRAKVKGKNLFMPLRLALTGKEHGPELKRLFPVIGIEKAGRRFERALAFQGAA